MSKKNILYRVYDKKGRYQQSYSAKLEDARSWAIDCATTLNGSVKEDLLNDNGDVEKTQNIFDSNEK